jgi:hypothetical protein
MSRAVITFIVAVTAFLGGVACSWLVAKRITDRAMEDFTWHLTSEPEGRVRVSLMTLKLLQRGDVSEAVRLNCTSTRSSLPLLGYPDLIPERKQSLDRLAGEAERVISALEASGKCGPR